MTNHRNKNNNTSFSLYDTDDNDQEEDDNDNNNEDNESNKDPSLREIIANSHEDDFKYPLALKSNLSFENALELAHTISWTDKGLSVRTESQQQDIIDDLDQKEIIPNKENINFPVGVEIDDFQEARNIIKNCSVVCGMHPDQVHTISYYIFRIISYVDYCHDCFLLLVYFTLHTIFIWLITYVYSFKICDNYLITNIINLYLYFKIGG